MGLNTSVPSSAPAERETLIRGCPRCGRDGLTLAELVERTGYPLELVAFVLRDEA